MANLKELRRRIASVKSTRRITAAISQIAAARLRRAQNAVLAARPYGERMQEVLTHLVGGIEPAERASAHPFLAQRPIRRVQVLVLTSDRGQCGAFNSSINRAATAYVTKQREAGHDVELRLIGNKAVAHFKRGFDVVGQHAAPSLATVVELSRDIGSHIMSAFSGDVASERADEVVMFYNHFVSVLTQNVTRIRLLPVDASESDESAVPPTFEPSRDEILAHLIPVAIESNLQQAMFNSIAAEIAARRVAMDSATDNAGEMIAELTLEKNRERQASITRELMEIIGGAEALKG